MSEMPQSPKPKQVMDLGEVVQDLKGESGLAAIIPEVFYDIIALLVPGFATLGFFYDLAPIRLRLPATASETATHLVLAYGLGHMLYALSIIVFDHLHLETPRKTLLQADPPPSTAMQHLFHRFKPTFHESFRNALRNEIQLRWNLPEDAFDAHLYYELCRHYLSMRSPDRARFIRKEQAYGELFRALTILGLLAMAFSWWTIHPWIALCLGGMVAAVSLYRYLYARQIDAFFVYLNFHIVVTSERRQVGLPNP